MSNCPSTDAGGVPGLSIWERSVPRLLHPLSVTIIEALAWVDEPLSATQIAKILDEEYGGSNLSYHLRRLRDRGVIVVARREKVRGALQVFYRLK